MKGSHRTGWFGLFAFICLALVTRPADVSPNLVISQVYGGKVALVIGNTSLGCNGGSSALPPRPLHATAARRCIHAPCRSQLAM